MRYYKTFARLKTKYGSTLDDIKLPISALANIDRYENGMTFISKIPNLPKDFKAKYRMINIPSFDERNELLSSSNIK